MKKCPLNNMQECDAACKFLQQFSRIVPNEEGVGELECYDECMLVMLSIMLSENTQLTRIIAQRVEQTGVSNA